MSTLRLTTISNQTGSSSVPSETVINGSAKAWVNFNGTGTIAIRASFNVSSITDGGAGTYTVNLTTAMIDANYSTNVNTKSDNFSISGGVSIYNNINITTVSVGSVLINTYSYTGSSNTTILQDMSIVAVAIFR